ncbi:Rpr2-domain-containing protein [Ganoderma leucocontextum]|nr:Rpr2-domain-containing protein [Ganoderma leucocontextum]
MGKKTKDQEPAANLNSVPNRDIIQRINFLYQASTYVNSIAPPPDGAVHPQRSAKRKKNTIRHPKNTAELSRCYVGAMRIIGQKTMIRMYGVSCPSWPRLTFRRDPTLKRTLCKRCDTVLLPGSTASVRIKTSGSHRQVVTYTCLACKACRRIPAPPVLDVNAAAPESAGPSTAQAAESSASTSTPGILAGALADIMDVDPPTGAAESAEKKGKGRNRRRRAVPRVPPLFERPGHAVFRGVELLPESYAY